MDASNPEGLGSQTGPIHRSQGGETSVEGQSRSSQPPQASSPPPSGRKRFWVTLAAVTVPVIGVLAIIVPIVVQRNQTSTSTETVIVREPSGPPSSRESPSPRAATPDPFKDAPVLGRVEDYSAGRYTKDWLVPASAPFDTFPTTPTRTADRSGSYRFPHCSPEQISWLEAHAVTSDAGVRPGVKLHNTADLGGALALTNVRFEGSDVVSEPLVAFECPVGGAGPTGALVVIKMDGSPGAWGELELDTGAPVTLNVSPGEVELVTFEQDRSVDRQRAYSGRILADAVGRGETFVLANDVEFRPAHMPGYFVGYGSPAWEDGRLRCRTPENGRTPGGPARVVSPALLRRR